VRRGMLWGVIAALAIAGIFDIIGIYAVMNAQGYPFTQAAFALFGAGKFPMGVSPWTPLFIPAVLSNPYLSSFVEFGFLLFNFWWAAGLALVSTRYVFAFSFDRVLPTFFADINDRLHIPLKATVLTFIIGAIITYIVVYTTYIGQLLNVITIWTIIWILIGISAIVFPFLRKDMAQGLVGGRWLLPICGVGTILGMGMTFYWSITIPALGVSLNPASASLLAVIFGSAVVIYLARYFYFKSRGLDLILVQKMIPPE